MSVSHDHDVRILALGITQRLLDRHENREILVKMDLLPPDFENIRSKGFRSPKNRSDQNFMNGTGHSFFHAIYCNCFSEGNTRENYDAIYCTLALLIVEVGYDENMLLEVFKLLLAIQEEIKDRLKLKGSLTTLQEEQAKYHNDVQPNMLSDDQVMFLNAFVACIFNLIGKLFAFTYKHLDEYVTGVLYHMSVHSKPLMEAQTAAKLK